MKRLLLCVFAVMLSGCATGQGQPDLPYNYWYVGLSAPLYMEVWVEGVDVVDQRGLAFERVHGGTVSYSNQTAGWHMGGGKMKQVPGVDLPEIIFVRWQSLVEPQTYNVRIDIPQWVRDEMVIPQRGYCKYNKSWKTDYMKKISIGMAPGGIAKVWLGGGCSDYKEIGRFVGEIEKRGPSQGKTEGRYAWPELKPESQAYIKKNGIPYGSW
ncbi:DUF2931 family protein [Pseudomonas sp. M30-35]|uniref:DUF2931 family protein n=1 Tax=Pseudomonas sp. M30-35 TaxID=1981174 RepID=UPI000B3C79BC|nr:DUF2931 family protein [Pseudomonas sp. M30-35]ARU89945.1 hypothetical protein B9K09_19105 [Pseudomonas sp. M30-35]